GKLAFDHQNKLFLSVGDRGNRHYAQGLDNHLGKILRLNRDGSIPKDNPFIDNPNILSEIWSYGHRNPQGLVYDHKSDQLWSTEHGPKGGDELNLIRPGVNYGWPDISWGREYSGAYLAPTHKNGHAQPQIYWTPSIAPSCLALDYHNNQTYLFAGALKYRQLRRIKIMDERPYSQQILLDRSIGRIRDVRIFNQQMWVAEDHRKAGLYQVENYLL
ncbi:MAG: PQQ-dependent sugar dehydrogenase, partial [Pseudomonadota bacterium]